MENINSTNNQIHNEASMSTTDLLIQALTAHFNDNPSNFTSYRNNVDQILREHIKPMTSRSGKSSDGDDWKSQTKQRFSGRGAKWVFVSLDQIESTLVNLEAEGVDCTEYRKNITKLGKAWIRFNGPRVKNGIQCAAFEVRTEGSTIDHPKQLHMINIAGLTDLIQTMPGTPKALKLEEDSAPMPKVKKKEKIKEVEIDTTSVQAIADEINDELEAEVALNEAPQSDDPAEWEAFLAAEGLTDPELDDLLNDDEF